MDKLDSRKDQKMMNVSYDPESLEQVSGIFEFEQARMLRLLPKILSYTATFEEAEEFWRTRDPIGETRSIKDVLIDCASTLYPNQAESINETSLYQNVGLFDIRAGIAAMSGALTGMTPYEIVQKMGSKHQDLGVHSVYDEDSLMLVEALSELLDGKTEFTTEEYEKLNTAREILGSANSKLYCVVRDNYSMGEEYAEGSYSFFQKSEQLDNKATIKLCEAIFISESQCHDHNKLEELDKIRLMGLRTLIHRCSDLEYTVKHDLDGYVKTLEGVSNEADDGADRIIKSGLKLLIVGMQAMFTRHDEANLIASHSTMGNRLGRGYIKGALHEALWYLDTAMIKQILADEYSDLVVYPTYSNCDEPRIGKPRWNRGVDYEIINGRNGTVGAFQIKSTKQSNKRHRKTYHPEISVLEEESFKEIQYDRLLAKLAVYQKILSGDLSHEECRKILDKYVMGSVWQAMDESLKDEYHHDDGGKKKSQISHQISSLGTISLVSFELPSNSNVAQKFTPNRQQRRAMAKEARKKAKYYNR